MSFAPLNFKTTRAFIAMSFVFLTGAQVSAQTLTTTSIGNACSYGWIFSQWSSPNIVATLNSAGTEVRFSIFDTNPITLTRQRTYEVIVSPDYQVNIIPGSACFGYLDPNTATAMSSGDPSWVFSLVPGQTFATFSVPYQPSFAGQTVYVQAYSDVPFPAPGLSTPFVTNALQLDF